MRVHREVQAGPLVAAAGALLLLVALFLDWYGADQEDLRFNAWTSFEVLDLVLAALALAAIAAAATGFGFPRWVPVRALPALGAAAFIVVASQLINHPPLFSFAEADMEIGAWLAFVGALAMLVGGLVSVARVSLAVNLSERDVPVREEPAAAPPPEGAPPPASATPPPPPAAEPAPPPGGEPAPPPAAPGPDDETRRMG